ncbi:hypothetical protein D9611_011799 [Ephemerocybe angulata]|uniref:Aldehyde dehydrogenase domain-containing protein n=1 Tax=Ephemerocybe angulata TaxID=980116 RepID=A0A8H5BY65_9AGAR|nr:hypothetical protein D9611_011799 [Tulosesus angulatus]
MSTPLSEIDKIHASLTSTFLSSLSQSSSPTKPSSTTPYPLLSLPYRQHQLLQLARLVQENADALCHSLWIDEGKPCQEIIMAEIGAVIGRALRGAREFESWVGGEEEIGEDVKLEGWQEAWRARIEKKAKGVVLIISPWNYPIILTFQPLCGAIAAGCPALIKPSEVVPTFSKLLADLVPKYLDPAAYRVALGGIPEITKILELKWAHIFYTGNGRVARIISAAAAKHLTPMTLELGGKSPVIIDGANLGEEELRVAARRVVWGKVNNSVHLFGCLFVRSLAFSGVLDDIPFGGVGESGYGRQPLKWTFEEFVYLRSVVEVPFSASTISHSMQFSLLALLPVFISLASIVNAHHDLGLHARDELSATRSFDESQLSLRELLGEMTTRELIEEVTERLERRKVSGTCPYCKKLTSHVQKHVESGDNLWKKP